MPSCVGRIAFVRIIRLCFCQRSFINDCRLKWTWTHNFSYYIKSKESKEQHCVSLFERIQRCGHSATDWINWDALMENKAKQRWRSLQGDAKRPSQLMSIRLICSSLRLQQRSGFLWEVQQDRRWWRRLERENLGALNAHSWPACLTSWTSIFVMFASSL